jgi:dolichol-phosphate mannosyltransferase
MTTPSSPNSNPWASVIIPIKDERENLSPLMANLLKVMDSHELSRSRPYEILFVHFDRNYGKTCALEAGFRQSSGEIIIQIDGDLQQDSEDILKLIPYTASHDVVCGWRQHRQDGFVKMISSRIANPVRNLFTHDGVHDTGCPLKVFRRPVLERIRLFEGMHRFFPALALMHGFTVTEVPVRHYPRIHGVSKYGMGNRLFKSLYDLIAVRWMQHRVLRYKFRDN